MPYNPNEPRDCRGRWTCGGTAELYAQTLYPAHPTEAELVSAKAGKGRSKATSKGIRVTIDHGDGTVEIRRGGSHAWRNNNPGNMVAGKFASEHGAIGSDGKFAIFPDEETGRKAMEALIKGKFANSTIDGTVTGWAPPSDGNDTAGYQKMVRGITRLPGNTVIRTLTPEQIRGVGQAIRRVEKWAPGTIVRGKK